MNVNQIGIKINQTTSNEGNAKLNTKSQSTTTINFDQIFSLFNLLGQSPNQTEQQAIPSTIQEPNKITKELQSFSTDDWTNLDSMLTVLLGGLQQAVLPSGLPNQVTTSSSTDSNPEILGNSNHKEFDTYNWQEIGSALTALLAGIQQLQDMKMTLANGDQSLSLDGKTIVSKLRNLIPVDNQIENLPFSSGLVSSGTSISKPAELILNLEKLIDKAPLQQAGQSDFNPTMNFGTNNGDDQPNSVMNQSSQSDLQLQDLNRVDQGQMVGKQAQQTSFDLPNEIISKIQTILSYINPAGSTSSNNNPFADTNNQFNSLAKSISLDKNELLLSYNPKNVNNNVSKIPLKKGSIPTDDFISKLQHLLQKPNGTIETKFQIDEPARVTVSDFVPEVSDWIGKSIGNLEGQFKSAETKFSLFPEHLGHIEVKITSQQGQITAQIVTDTSSAKEALEGQLQHLKQAIQQHGIIVQKLDIIQQLPSTTESGLGNFSFSQGGSSSGEQRALYMDRESGKKQTDLDSVETENESLPVSYGGTLKPVSTIDFSA